MTTFRSKESFTHEKELLKGLTDEQIAKVKACKNQEELLELAKEEGIEIAGEQLRAIGGAGVCSTGYEVTCPKCDSLDVDELEDGRYRCNKCKKVFED